MSIYPSRSLAWIPFFIYCLQLCIVTCLFLYSYQNFDGTWTDICKRNMDASIEERTLMSVVALLLFVECIVRIKEFQTHRDESANAMNLQLSKSNEPQVTCIPCDSDPDFLEASKPRIWSSWLGPLSWIDYLSELVINSAIIVLNLWVVFLAKSTLDMVINSLALQFIADLDNKCKRRLCNMNHQKLMKSFNDEIQKKPKGYLYKRLHKMLVRSKDHGNDFEPTLLGCLIFYSAIGISAGLTPLIAFAFAIYGPICKSG
jgi:hypothetical protein